MSNANIREAIDQLILEEQAEANNSTVDNFIPQKNESENLINEITKSTINNVGNDLINEVENLKINNVGNNIINKFANLTISDVGNDSAGISHQNLLSGQMIGIR